MLEIKLIPIIYSDSFAGTECLLSFLNEEVMQDKYRKEDFMLAFSVRDILLKQVLKTLVCGLLFAQTRC